MSNPTGHTISIKNSQFKAAWQSGPTRTIRVPIALAEVTLEYARQLDQGIEPRDTREISDAGISAATIEPHDTEINADSQVDNPIDTVAIESRDNELQIELGNSETDETFTVPDAKDIESLKEENEELKRLLDKKSPLTLGDFYVELQKLRERNRELKLKIGEERRSSIVQICDLKRQLEGVTDKELQNELSNLKAENEKLSADYAALLQSSTHVTNKLRQEVQELRSQLEAQKTSWEELQEELDDRDEVCERLRSQLTDREAELAAVRSELADLKQKSAPASKDLPEAADLLNQLKTRRKKSSASLADIEAILEMIEES